MAKIKIETITPVHIGSGELLKRDNDYVLFDGGESIGVIDERKVLSLVGEEHINEWVSYIERGESIKTLINKYAAKAKIEDWTKRIIDNYAERCSSLKECIHDGMGRPYIPGSSIKGAIRTAVLSQLVKNDKNLERFIERRVSAKEIEQYYFGADPNQDFFRFIQVGDAYFESNVEVALNLVSLNIRSSHHDLLDESKSQPIEAINWENTATFNLRFNRQQYSLAQGRVKSIPTQIETLDSLFHTINAHTQSLLQYELDFWNNEVDKSGAEDYLEKIEELLAELELCRNTHSCLLRIGHASGWNFTTGAWSRRMRNFDDMVVPQSRPRNNKDYAEYPFPKTRRIIDDSGLLGFVKLTKL